MLSLPFTRFAGRARLGAAAAIVLVPCLGTAALRASDHADPVAAPGLTELFDNGVPTTAAADKLAGGITDLFVFPVDADNHLVDFFPAGGDAPAADPTLSKEVNDHRALYAKLTPDQRAFYGLPVELTPGEQARIKGLAVIFDVRRSLTKPDVAHLKLTPFVYRVNFDTHTRVLFSAAEGQPGEFKQFALTRYGGSIPNPEQIGADYTLEFTLNDDATVKRQNFANFAHADRIRVVTGIRNDPFIFPTFADTNVVAMMVIIPIECFLDGRRDFLAWGTSSEGKKQLDHVGRSLRTQNPRFDMLNTLPPKEHLPAIIYAENHPSLMTDLALKFKIQGLFQFRKWDEAPDVMIYSTRFNVGFPNGRRLSDDVASLLAQNGDTLLLENSYLGTTGPRVTTQNKKVSPDFPYLAEPNDTAVAPADHILAPVNKMIIAALLVAGLVGLGIFVLGLVALYKMLFAKASFPG